jgi:hypothetical protein
MEREKLFEFSLDHYNYINQLLGDQTIREIIQEVYENKDWELITEESPDFDSFHHLLQGKGKKKKMQWCSVEEGLQDPETHPYDTLCQSYSVLKYLDGLDKTDTKLTKKVQMKMIDMWSKLIEVPEIKEQIIDSVTQKQGGKYVMENIDKKYRNRKIIDKIKEVLDDWENYGYKYFMLKK